MATALQTPADLSKEQYVLRRSAQENIGSSEHRASSRARTESDGLPTCLVPFLVFLLLLFALLYHFFMLWSDFWVSPQQGAEKHREQQIHDQDKRPSLPLGHEGLSD